MKSLQSRLNYLTSSIDTMRRRKNLSQMEKNNLFQMLEEKVALARTINTNRK